MLAHSLIALITTMPPGARRCGRTAGAAQREVRRAIILQHNHV